MATEGPGHAPAASQLTALPKIEDIPSAGDGLDADAVRGAFDAFRRHAAQLQAQLRVLQAAGSRTTAAVEPYGPRGSHGRAAPRPRRRRVRRHDRARRPDGVRRPAVAHRAGDQPPPARASGPRGRDRPPAAGGRAPARGDAQRRAERGPGAAREGAGRRDARAPGGRGAREQAPRAVAPPGDGAHERGPRRGRADARVGADAGTQRHRAGPAGRRAAARRRRARAGGDRRGRGRHRARRGAEHGAAPAAADGGDRGRPCGGARRRLPRSPPTRRLSRRR